MVACDAAVASAGGVAVMEGITLKRMKQIAVVSWIKESAGVRDR